jgi:hypothetical protein
VLTNFLHHFDTPTCVGLLKKVRAALKPGGRAAALEFVPNEDRVSPADGRCVQPHHAGQHGPRETHYTFSELEKMYRDAGFGDITAHPVPTGPHTIVLGPRGVMSRPPATIVPIRRTMPRSCAGRR